MAKSTSCNIQSSCQLPFVLPAVLPDFAQVYSFIGSVFDPDMTDHLEKLKRMDPIDVETVCAVMKFNLIEFVSYYQLKINIYMCELFTYRQVLLLMRNLSINLTSPDFEDQVSSTCSSSPSPLLDYLTYHHIRVKYMICWWKSTTVRSTTIGSNLLLIQLLLVDTWGITTTCCPTHERLYLALIRSKYSHITGIFSISLPHWFEFLFFFYKFPFVCFTLDYVISSYLIISKPCEAVPHIGSFLYMTRISPCWGFFRITHLATSRVVIAFFNLLNLFRGSCSQPRRRAWDEQPGDSKRGSSSLLMQECEWYDEGIPSSTCHWLQSAFQFFVHESSVLMISCEVKALEIVSSVLCMWSWSGLLLHSAQFVNKFCAGLFFF